MGQLELPSTTSYGEYTDKPVNSLQECLDEGLTYIEKVYSERQCADCYYEAGYYCARNCNWTGDLNNDVMGDGGFLTDYKCEEVHAGLSASFVDHK